MQARDWLSSYWSGYNSPSQLSRIRNTGVPNNFLKEVRGSCCCVCLPLAAAVTQLQAHALDDVMPFIVSSS